MRARVGAFVLCCLLLTPVAVAAEAEGSFKVRGKVTAPTGATVEGTPLAALAKDTADVTAFTLHIPKGIVHALHVVEQNVAGVSVRTDYRLASWPVADATARLLDGGDHGGYLGLYPSEGSQFVALAAQADTEPHAVSTISSEKAAAGDKRTTRAYHETISRPHVLVVAQGSVTHTGEGSVKVQGLDIEISQARGNTTRHQTGVKTSGMERTFTWVFIELREAGTLTLTTPEPLTVALAEATLNGTGALAFTPTEGALRTSEGAYLATGKASSVEGTFRASLAPLPDGRTARLDLSGDVRPSSSFVRHPAPSAFGAESPAWWGVALVLGAVAIVGGGAAAVTAGVLRRRHRRRVESLAFPFTVEDCKDAAESYMEEGKHERALEWLERGLRLAPRSARFRMDAGFCHAEMGHGEEALRLYQEADALSPEHGEAALSCARLLKDTDRSLAHTWARIALKKTPALVHDVLEAFPEVRHDSTWDEALDAAFAVLEQGWTDRHG